MCLLLHLRVPSHQHVCGSPSRNGEFDNLQYVVIKRVSNSTVTNKSVKKINRLFNRHFISALSKSSKIKTDNLIVLQFCHPLCFKLGKSGLFENVLERFCRYALVAFSAGKKSIWKSRCDSQIPYFFIVKIRIFFTDRMVKNRKVSDLKCYFILIRYLWNWALAKSRQTGERNKNNIFGFFSKVKNNIHFKSLWRLKRKSMTFKNIFSVFPDPEQFGQWAVSKKTKINIRSFRGEISGNVIQCFLQLRSIWWVFSNSV